jgi:erythromycin esterase-like protein
MPRTDSLLPVKNLHRDYGQLLERANAARFVLLGEASHGTHEFYRERAEITKRLIAERGFTGIAAEADWPDAYRVNLYIRAQSDDSGPAEALADFRRFPAWMWRNTDVVDFVAWLRAWNDRLPAGRPRVGFYGLDLYSLHASMEAVVAYLDRVDPDAAARARERYACFDHFGPDPQAYGYETGVGGVEPCEQEVVEQLVELRNATAELVARDGGRVAADSHFYAEQNARLVANAEEYYRAMFRGSVASWNLRDRHMAETLEAVAEHLERVEGPTRMVVWAHNSHVGDARATQLGEAGELNIGQLVRERHGEQSLLVGFTTYTGTVTAASDWGGPAERKRVRPAIRGSWEDLFHETGETRFLVEPRGLDEPRLERAMGVIYRPQTELASHYFRARLGEQFDAMIHIDESRAVEPLERTVIWDQGELPETYPWAV